MFTSSESLIQAKNGLLTCRITSWREYCWPSSSRCFPCAKLQKPTATARMAESGENISILSTICSTRRKKLAAKKALKERESLFVEPSFDNCWLSHGDMSGIYMLETTSSYTHVRIHACTHAHTHLGLDQYLLARSAQGYHFLRRASWPVYEWCTLP